MDREAILKNFVQVQLSSDEDFLKIKETLTRMGVANRRDKKLWQSCHILHKKGNYYIVHFKEMFQLDNGDSDISAADYARRNRIAKLLEDWGMLKIVSHRDQVEANLADMSDVMVIPHREKGEWELIPKYTIGRKARTTDATAPAAV